MGRRKKPRRVWEHPRGAAHRKDTTVDSTRIDDPRGEVDLAEENLLRVLDNVALHAPDEGYEFGGFGEYGAMSRLRRAIVGARVAE
jgi:hypothetical protein